MKEDSNVELAGNTLLDSEGRVDSDIPNVLEVVLSGITGGVRKAVLLLDEVLDELREVVKVGTTVTIVLVIFNDEEDEMRLLETVDELGPEEIGMGVLDVLTLSDGPPVPLVREDIVTLVIVVETVQNVTNVEFAFIIDDTDLDVGVGDRELAVMTLEDETDTLRVLLTDI